MPFSTKAIKSAIQKSLTENEFVITFEGNDGYYLIQSNNSLRTFSMQLVLSNLVAVIRQSHESNEVSMNYFKLNIPIGKEYPVFILMALENAGADYPEFLIIPSFKLNEKLFDMGLSWKRKIELCFLVYPDGKVFDTTSLSGEGRNLLSKGLDGRMADGSIYDFSEWVNYWDGLNYF